MLQFLQSDSYFYLTSSKTLKIKDLALNKSDRLKKQTTFVFFIKIGSTRNFKKF